MPTPKPRISTYASISPSKPPTTSRTYLASWSVYSVSSSVCPLGRYHQLLDCVTAYSHAASRCAHSAAGAPAGQSSHVVSSPGRAVSAAQRTPPPSDALSAASVHGGEAHRSPLPPKKVLVVGKQRDANSSVRLPAARVSVSAGEGGWLARIGCSSLAAHKL